MERESFVFYRSFYEAISEIEDKTLRMDCFDALVKYGLYGIEPEGVGIVQMVFKFIKPQIDANNRRFANGLKGGRPKKENQEITKIKPKENQNITNPKPNVNVNVNVNDNVNDNVNVNVKENPGGSKRTRFTKPTVEEISAYCRERGNQVDAQRFFDFYESKGWRVGDQGMKDWKACVRTWERPKGSKVSSFNQFQQNNYDFKDLEERLLDN